MSKRNNALADRLEQRARTLATFASALTDAEWQTRVPRDGRKIGDIVHHAATVYPLEGELHTELKDGRKFTLRPGMSYQIADDAEPHRSYTELGARLFVVD